MTSGADPIDPCPRHDDEAHMPVSETRYPERERVTGPPHQSSSPTDGAVTKVQQLQASIHSGTYAVDSQAVATAILKRLLLGEEPGK
jgi:anti-sigma28 factor (negative regulator of flagellin synthesis)